LDLKDVSELCTFSKKDLLKVRNYGFKVIEEIERCLGKLNLKLKDENHPTRLIKLRKIS